MGNNEVEEARGELDLSYQECLFHPTLGTPLTTEQTTFTSVSTEIHAVSRAQRISVTRRAETADKKKTMKTTTTV